jgi:hypothetical protein
VNERRTGPDAGELGFAVRHTRDAGGGW